MPAETNFQIFNEANDASTTYNDSEYTNATQRLTGVTPGMALSRMHNKMYRQWSVMCKAIADMMVAKGYSAMDDNEQQIAEDLQAIIDAAASDFGYLLRKNSTQYEVGDVAFSASLPSSLVLECTTAGTTAATAPDFSGAAEGDTIQDGTVVWTYKGLLSDDGANTDLSNLTATGENHFLERDFAIIYPNGGSESNPANVTNNSRYVETNPFPGYVVDCAVEIKQGDKWGDPGKFTENVSGTYSCGIRARQLDNDAIIVQCASTSITTNSVLSLNPFGLTTTLTSAPCRVKVWKIGKVANNA